MGKTKEPTPETKSRVIRYGPMKMDDEVKKEIIICLFKCMKEVFITFTICYTFFSLIEKHF